MPRTPCRWLDSGVKTRCFSISKRALLQWIGFIGLAFAFFKAAGGTCSSKDSIAAEPKAIPGA
ncbi:MAG: hypothetical protein QOE83_350 [Actinomycetota bacterium]|nr:hypothetical protein [Actinomycetota bacterium]